MRLIVWTTALLALSAGGAGASSFVSIAPPKQAPSVITIGIVSEPVQKLGLPASPPPELTVVSTRGAESSARSGAIKLVSISPSVIAFEGPEPRVTSEKVAAVKQGSSLADPVPMVIRGGIVGDPFGTAEAPVAETAKGSAGPAGKPGVVQASESGKKAPEADAGKPSQGDKASANQQAQGPADQQAPPQPAPSTGAAPRQAIKPE